MRLSFKARGQSTPAAERAFTLVEAMIAAAIVAIVYAVVFYGIASTFRLLETTRENLRATQIIVSRLEGIRLCAWDSTQLFNPTIVPPTFTDSFYPIGLGSTTNTGTIYYGTMTITTNPPMTPAASYAPSMALVNVSVTWTDVVANASFSTANVHTRAMSTYVSQYGLQNYVFSSH